MTRLWLVGLLLAATLSGCGDDVAGVAAGGTVSVALDLAPAHDAGFDIDGATVRFAHTASDEVVSQDLDVRGDRASAEIALRPGRWDVEVELFEGEELAGAGEGSVLVIQGFVTEINLAVELETGGVRINVEWAEGFEGVIADVSHRPVQVVIEGIGTFQAQGLSRIGWDIEVIETPTQGGRTHKEAGGLRYTDVAVLGLTGSHADAQALAAEIIGSAEPRAVQIMLQGYGGEQATVLLLGAVALDGEPALVQAANGEWTVGGVLFGDIARITLQEHQVVGLVPTCPAPGQQVEVDGVAVDLCYPEDVLQVPAPGTSDDLLLPAVRQGETLYLWASQHRDDVEQAGCIGCDRGSRRSMSVIDRDAEGDELGRVNIFEVWASRFTLFNPDARYGHGYLFYLNLVSDFVERG